MAAITETSGPIVVAAAGNKRVIALKCDGTLGSAGTITFDELSGIDSIALTFAEAITTDCNYIACISISTNVATIATYEADFTVSTQNAIDFYVVAIGTAAYTS